MADNTHIEWTATVHPDGTTTPGASWNPIRAHRRDGKPNKGPGGWACQRVSPGCQHCYAATINKRLGTGLDYDAKGIAGSHVTIDEKALTLPLRWRKPRKVFVCSMTDLFGEWVTDEMLDRIFAVMALTPQHTYQVLTKRAERMREYLKREWGRFSQMTLPNVWVGVSAENQEQADARINALLETPAALRWISAEPLLGPLNLVRDRNMLLTEVKPDIRRRMVRLDWVVVGGESGPGARPMDIEWARWLVRQCKAADVPVFVKQLGPAPIDRHATCADNHEPEECWPVGTLVSSQRINLGNRKGGDPEEWPEDLRIREFPRGAA